MREVMERRALELINLENYPDLLIIDWWKGQLSSVMEIVEKNNLHWLQVVSLAKREEELFIPGKSEPIVLWKTSPELRMIQKIRDESHRFAITFNRDSRIKAMKKNI
jgi:excinuclease ABC subunit C